MHFLKRAGVVAASFCLATLLWNGSAFAAEVTVKPGDSLWAIANRTGTTVEAIKKLNNLSSDLIHPGNVLKVPDKIGNKSWRPANAVQRVSRGEVNRGEAVVDYAKQFIGVPYRSGGTTPAGFDCSGYVSYVFKHFGIDLVHTAAGQYNAGPAVNKANLQPGDLVFFNTGGGISHSGIYVGNNQFIHASTSQGVIISSLEDSYWAPKYRGANRIIR